MNSREEILNRINEVGKNSTKFIFNEKDNDLKIKREIEAITPKDNAELWAQFENELKIISGEINFIKNIDQAEKIILEFLKESKYERIGISNESICREIADNIHKKNSNVKIISPAKLSYEERKKEFAITEMAIVNPTYAVADIGSLVFLYDQTGTSYPHFLCDNTFVIIYKNQIVANQFELFEKIDAEKSKNMVFITGPSRTADIEKVIVLGAHGPKKLIVLCLEE